MGTMVLALARDRVSEAPQALRQKHVPGNEEKEGLKEELQEHCQRGSRSAHNKCEDIIQSTHINI